VEAGKIIVAVPVSGGRVAREMARIMVGLEKPI
jgi:hypothetical protein